MSKTNRIWEIDLLKTIAFIMMFIDHLSYDIYNFILPKLNTNTKIYDILNIISKYKYNNYNYIVNFFFSFGLFIFISGLLSTMSSNNFKRGLKIFIIATVYLLCTILVDTFSYYVIGSRLYVHVFFGILSSIGLMTIFSSQFKKLPNYALYLLGVGIIIIGFILRFTNSNHNIFYIFGLHRSDVYYSDYHPLFPALGIYFLGILVGKVFYKEKKSIFNRNYKLKFCEFVSKNSLKLYFIHQFVLIGICLLIGLFIS